MSLLSKITEEELKMLMVAAWEYSQNATCNRLSVGAIIIDDDLTILGHGSNRAPEGMPSCYDDGCLMYDNSCKRTVHAEANAVMNAIQAGHNIRGKMMIVTHRPCPDCMKLITQYGLHSVVYDKEYTPKYKYPSNAIIAQMNTLIVMRKTYC